MSFAVEPRASGVLYVCGTPIGNLEDITLRALRVLREVELVAAEDTRRTRQLLQHFDIRKPLLSLHEHNEEARREEVVARLAAGERVALVSDAGMPGISDPGMLLVQACIAAGVQVVPVPGPTAFVAALVAGGLPTDRFVFEGFLPRRGRGRRERLRQLAAEVRTIVLYEAPHRLLETLADLADELGADRRAVVARELTKVHESFVRGTLAEVKAHFAAEAPRGECVLIVGGATAQEEVVQPAPTDEAIREAIAARMQAGASRRDAVKQVATEWSLPKRQVYAIALSAEGEKTGV